MMREANIPFLLWLPAALVFHLAGGGGAAEAAKVMHERADILAFSRDVRSEVRDSLMLTVEISGDFEELEDEEKEEEPEDTSDEPEDEDAEPSDEEIEPPPPEPVKPKPLATQAPIPKPKPKPKAPEPEPKKVALPTPKPPEPEKKPEPKPKPPEKKEPPPEKLAKKEKAPEKKEKKDDEKKVAKLELPKPDGRIAIQNDPSLAKDQKDNPNANRIADYANSVKEETMARFRSYDQNASKPTGGGDPTPSPLKQAGNSHEDRGGFSNQVEGEGPPKPGSEDGPEEPSKEPIARSQQGSDEPPPPGQEGRAAVKGLKARAAGTGAEASETLATDGANGAASGSWSISADPGGDGRPKQKGRKGRKAIAGRAAIPGIPGLSGPAALPQKYSINAYGLVDALGKQHLRQEREKARNTRLRRHRGSFKANTFEEYRAAIENYDPSVKPGNQTSLNAARVPFASFVNMMHNRIHPIFAVGFLGSLGNLGPDDKLSNLKLSTHLELVLDGETGAVTRAGVVRGSGVTAFDVAAISSAKSAGPFGKAPDMIVSPDGNVYVHWEFYRDPYYACTSKFARPYLIKGTPKKNPSGPGPRRPSGSGSEEPRASRPGPLRPTR
ncbi:MAG: hypothetical protein RIF41_05215 [Polyangiaceae bacterium]